MPHQQLLAPLAAPEGRQAATDRLVCNCLNVSASAMLASLQQGLDLSALQRELRCGTQCGSCLPEIRRMVSAP
ncbi:BFD-like [2Fe-2S] binding domain protein [compost metagenome]